MTSLKHDESNDLFQSTSCIIPRGKFECSGFLSECQVKGESVQIFTTQTDIRWNETEEEGGADTTWCVFLFVHKMIALQNDP